MSLYQTYDCIECLENNQALYTRFMSLEDADYERKSHLFDGRYENLYVKRESIPQIEMLLQTALQQASGIIGMPASALRLGFWFNLMQPGHVTTLHRHDDDDELLSGVYYLCVPPHSGNLVFHHQDQQKIVEPREGRFVFFSPQLAHEVTRHEGVGERISIAFNIGPLHAELD